MRRTWYLWSCAALTTIALMCGCTSPSLFRLRAPTSPSLTGPTQLNASSTSNTASGSASTASFGSESAPTDGFGNLPTQIPTSFATTGGVVLTSLRQAGTSVSNALKIQSKVSPAVDPLMLNNQPANSARVAADLHYHAGYFKETQKDFVAAAAHYREVLQKLPNDVRALAGYGRVQDQLGNTVEAEKFLRRACELAPQDAAPLNDLAQSYARQKNMDAAITSQQQAVTLQPTNPLYRSSLASLLVDAGRDDEAVQQLAAVHGEATAHFQVGCLLYERRATDLARQHLQRSLTLNPSLAPARQMLDRWQVAATGSRPQRGPSASSMRLPLP